MLLVYCYHQPQLSGVRLVAMALLLLAFGGAGINLTYLCHFMFVVSRNMVGVEGGQQRSVGLDFLRGVWTPPATCTSTQTRQHSVTRASHTLTLPLTLRVSSHFVVTLLTHFSLTPPSHPHRMR